MIDKPDGAHLQAGAVWRIHRAVDGIARAVFFLPYVHDIVTAHALAQLVGHFLPSDVAKAELSKKARFAASCRVSRIE